MLGIGIRYSMCFFLADLSIVVACIYKDTQMKEIVQLLLYLLYECQFSLKLIDFANVVIDLCMKYKCISSN